MLLLGIVVAVRAGEVRAQVGSTADFDAASDFIRDHYCFFESGPSDWEQSRKALRVRAVAAVTTAQSIRVLEDLLDQLADPHCHLRTNLASSHRLIPYDVWGRRTAEGLLVEGVREGANAALAGVLPGDVVVRINGLRALVVSDAARPQFSLMTDAVLNRWSVQVALAGSHDTPRVWTVRSGGSVRSVDIDAVEHATVIHELIVSTAEPAPDVGLIRIGTFSDASAVGLFDEALDRFINKPALVIDVRNNRGGDTAVARPIMGRFVRTRSAHATMRRRAGDKLGAPWTEFVHARGTRYQGRVIILIDRFSVSMAEGFAMGMRTINGATLVGTRMAGLGAAIGTHTLPESGITLQISTEPVYTTKGEPRWEIVPDVLVPIEAMRERGDAILQAGLRVAHRGQEPITPVRTPDKSPAP